MQPTLQSEPTNPDREYACYFCGSSTAAESMRLREMMFGTRHEFDYLVCDECGAIQIASIPENLGDYYPPEYYSLDRESATFVKKWMKRVRARHALGEESWLGAKLVERWGNPPYVDWVRQGGVGWDDAILDVGSGSGFMLHEMSNAGFRKLTGVDPYIKKDLAYSNGVRVLKRTLDEIDSQFDFVMLHHSFEHVPNPGGTLRQVARILKPGRTALIRTPVMGCWAWRTFREHWVQLDPPRHLFIPTVRAMETLCGKSGLAVRKVMYDSTSAQIWGSEQARNGIPLCGPRSYASDPRASSYDPATIREYEERARKLNEEGDGDQACFYLVHATEIRS